MYDIRAPGAGALSQDGLSYCFVKRTVVLGSCVLLLCEEDGGAEALSQDGLSYCFVKRKVVLRPCHKMDCLIAL